MEHYRYSCARFALRFVAKRVVGGNVAGKTFGHHCGRRDSRGDTAWVEWPVGGARQFRATGEVPSHGPERLATTGDGRQCGTVLLLSELLPGPNDEALGGRILQIGYRPCTKARILEARTPPPPPP